MSSLHHSFDIDYADVYGVREAIIIHHFQHWVRINQKLKKNFKEGKTWTFQTIDEIAVHFPYMSKSEIFDIIQKLCLGKGRRSKKNQEFPPVLMKGNFNKKNYDKTIWYAFVDEDKFIGQPKVQKLVGESQQGDRLEPAPIPHTKTHTKKEEVVCYPPPKGVDIKDSLSKEELKKKSVEEALRGLKIPSTLNKLSITGGTINISLQDIFLKASQNRTDWKVEEIHDAWKILEEYQGKIREPISFIEGTIKNMRTKKKSEFLKTKESKWKKSNNQHITEIKETSLEKDLSEHPSLGSILEQMGKSL